MIVLVSIVSEIGLLLSHHLEGLRTYTPLKTNVSPENQWLEDVFPTEIVPFLGDMLVFRGVLVGGFSNRFYFFRPTWGNDPI